MKEAAIVPDGARADAVEGAPGVRAVLFNNFLVMTVGAAKQELVSNGWAFETGYCGGPRGTEAPIEGA
ncbi:MAG: hypothetical protein Q9227_003214 [Pyrenula ochraceoflavens]